jgi:hypothetical protein
MCPSRHRLPLQSSSAPVRDSLPPGQPTPARSVGVALTALAFVLIIGDASRFQCGKQTDAGMCHQQLRCGTLFHLALDRLTQFGSAEGEFGRIAAPGSNAWELTFNVSATFLFFLCRQNAYRGARRNAASPVRISFASSLNGKAWLWLLAHDADDCETLFGVGVAGPSIRA